MSFSFGFDGDDIEDEELEAQDALANDLSKTTISAVDQPGPQSRPPRRHSLEEMLASLPSQISYNTVRIVPSARVEERAQDGSGESDQHQDHIITKIYRRSLFDIRAQLMAEASPSVDEADAAETVLSGLENGDLSRGIYEGGFKTWECALDLASLLISNFSPLLSGSAAVHQDLEIIELGAGSAVPSLTVLRHFLYRKQRSGDSPNGGSSLKMTLCDYNEDVLRLGTAPNVFLNYISTVSALPRHEANIEEGELDIEELGGEPFVKATMTDLLAHKVTVDFISGGWGDAFNSLLNLNSSRSPSARAESSQDKNHATNLLVLTSETIYSPTTIRTFSQTLINLLLSHQQRHADKAKAWVAAKKVYFGVGGDVDEFVREVESLGGRSSVIFETKGTGVGRVVLEVTVES